MAQDKQKSIEEIIAEAKEFEKNNKAWWNDFSNYDSEQKKRIINDLYGDGFDDDSFRQ